MNKIGVIVFFISIILFGISFSQTITGNVFSENVSEINWLRFITIGLFIISLFMMSMRKSLDMLIIPTGGKTQNDQRVKRALEEDKKRGIDYYLISGVKDTKELKNTQRADIYNQLREYGIPPKRIKVSGGENTNENAEEAVKKIKGMENLHRIGIVSYPAHLDRFKQAIEKYKSDLPKGIEFERVETEQTAKQGAYSFLNNIYQKYLPKNNPIIKGIKNFVRKIMS